MKRLALIAAVALTALAPSARAKTWVIPHLIDKAGSTSSTPFTFDTTIYIVYTPGLGDTRERRYPNGHVTLIKLWLFDDEDQALRSASGEEVCNPCTFERSSSSPRKQSIRIDDLIVARGGFPGGAGGVGEPVTGYAVMEMDDRDAAGVSIQGFVVNSHTGPFDLSVFGFTPEEVKANLAP